MFGNVYTWQGGLTLELTSSGTVQSMQEQTRRTPKKGESWLETRARKRTIVQKLQVSQMYNQKPLYAGSSYNIEGGLHMSCHYQPLIVPSQHFSIYSDSSVPSGRYAWLTKQVRRLDVFLRHYSWYSLGESEILDYTFPSRQINNPSDLNCLIYATFWAILLHNEWTVFLKVWLFDSKFVQNLESLLNFIVSKEPLKLKSQKKKKNEGYVKNT